MYERVCEGVCERLGWVCERVGVGVCCCVCAHYFCVSMACCSLLLSPLRTPVPRRAVVVGLLQLYVGRG